MRTLRIPIQKKWFDMIVSGIKKEEYRGKQDHWKNRLVTSIINGQTKWREYDQVLFHNGYRSDCPQALIQFLGVTDNEGLKLPEWGYEKESYIIKLGDIISVKNYKG